MRVSAQYKIVTIFDLHISQAVALNNKARGLKNKKCSRIIQETFLERKMIMPGIELTSSVMIKSTF
jgi:hypothetical protein